MKSKWIVISLIVSALSGACTTTQQSRMGIGLGLAGSAVGVGLSAAGSSSGDSGVTVLGLALGVVSSWAMVAGAGSLGPNERLDRLESLAAMDRARMDQRTSQSTATRSSAANAPAIPQTSPTPLATQQVPEIEGTSTEVAPEPLNLTPMPLPESWRAFGNASVYDQNEFLAARRSLQTIGVDPVVLVPVPEGCPERHVELRRIDFSSTEPTHVVCRRLIDPDEEPAAD
jgi:hypothetical protein